MEDTMKTSTSLLSILLLTLFSSCSNNHGVGVVEDYIPPLPPVGIVSVSLDNAVELQWIPNQEPDLSGYNVYVSNRYDGRYALLGTTTEALFVDKGARNGITYYYAVTAFDFSGNESDLSKDIVYDTPRPEGYNVRLQNRFTRPEYAGYDFSTFRVVHFDTDNTDIYVEFATNGQPYFVVWEDSDIQDMGWTETLDDITQAPQRGWSPTKDAHIILGHTYVVWTFDDHYAKVRVIEITSTSVAFDWAYQVDPGNPELFAKKSPAERHRGKAPVKQRTE